MNRAGELRTGGSSRGGEPKVPVFIATRLPLAARFIKFCLVGGGVLVDMAVFLLLAARRTIDPNINFGKTCAAEIAHINSFIWNEHWTFTRGAHQQMPSGLFRRLILVTFWIFGMTATCNRQMQESMVADTKWSRNVWPFDERQINRKQICHRNKM
jgi:hypothetical protein